VVAFLLYSELRGKKSLSVKLSLTHERSCLALPVGITKYVWVSWKIN
jgi:hypothetical protein